MILINKQKKKKKEIGEKIIRKINLTNNVKILLFKNNNLIEIILNVYYGKKNQ